MEYRDRPEGSESKLNTIPDGIKVLRTIVKLYRSYIHLRFFGIIAAILAALSVIFYSRVDGLPSDRAGRTVPHADCLRYCNGGGFAHVCRRRDTQHTAAEGSQGL